MRSYRAEYRLRKLNMTKERMFMGLKQDLHVDVRVLNPEGLSHAMKLAVSIEENKLFGSPSQGCAPAEIARFGTNGTCVESINNKVKLFNDRLKPLVDNINSNFTDARFTFINVTSITTPEGGVAGAAPSNIPCCQLRSDGQCIPNSTPCANRNLFIWFDGFHPTEIANTVLATRSYTAQSPTDASPFDISRLAAI
ncbi:hypothetical protein Tco_1235586 [Tanacetum coccineum]